MKSIFLSILGLLFFQIAHSQQTLSLSQAIDTGIANNFDVNRAGLLMQKEGINYRQSRAFMLPDLNAFANHGLNQGRSIDPFTNQYINQNVSFASYGASSNLLLFNGLSLQNQIKSDKLGFEASQKEWQQAKDNLTINIILAYLQVLSAQDVLEQSRQQILVSKQQVDRLTILNSEGAIAPSDLYDLRGQAANDQLTVTDNEASLALAKLTLCQLLNIPYNKDLQIERLDIDKTETDYSANPENIYNTALKNFAAIEASGLRVQSAESNVKRLKGNLFPTLSLGGNINTNYSNAATQSFFRSSQQVVSSDFVTVGGTEYNVTKTQSDFDVRKIPFGDQLSNNLFSTVTLNLAIPLFNASKVKNSIRLAKIDWEQSRLADKNAKISLQQAIEKAYVEMVNAKNKVDVLKDQVEAFTESFRSAEIRFNSGVINSVDYLIAKNNLDRSRINLILARYDLALRQKVLAYFGGKRLW